MKFSLFTEKPTVAVLDLEKMFYQMPAFTRTRIFDNLKNDNHIRAVLIRCSTKSAKVVDNEELCAKIIDIKKKKPVVVSIGAVCTGYTYMGISSASSIVANKSSVIELIPTPDVKSTKMGSSVKQFVSETIMKNRTCINESQWPLNYVSPARAGVEYRIDGVEAQSAQLVDYLGTFDFAETMAASLAGHTKEEVAYVEVDPNKGSEKGFFSLPFFQ